jgi:hypothetical protein
MMVLAAFAGVWNLGAHATESFSQQRRKNDDDRVATIMKTIFAVRGYTDSPGRATGRRITPDRQESVTG